MARKRSRLDFNNEAPGIGKRHRAEKTGWKKERLLALKLLLEGELDIAAVARLVGRHRNSINDWIKLFLNGGIEALLKRGEGSGRKGKMTAEAKAELTENLKIITLPAYSPELNPVEKFWDIVKDTICNKTWPTLEALEEKITVTLRKYWEDTSRVLSLFLNSYLRSELNGSKKTIYLFYYAKLYKEPRPVGSSGSEGSGCRKGDGIRRPSP